MYRGQRLRRLSLPAFQARGALDDGGEHRAGLAALGRAVRFPDVGPVRGRMFSKSPSLFTLSGANSVMSTSPAQSSRCLISSQLGRPRHRDRAPSSARSHEHPRPFQLEAVERELQVALLQGGVDVGDLGRPRALSHSITIPAP